jgi:hypothetical protein
MTMVDCGSDGCPFDLMTREKERSWRCAILCSSLQKKEVDKMLTGSSGSNTVQPRWGNVKLQRAQEVFVEELFMGRSNRAACTHFCLGLGRGATERR